MSTNKSNSADRPVRMIAVYADGRVQHRDMTNGRAPWNRGTGWGARAAASDTPEAGPGEAPTPAAAKVKDPRKVAAGKARAEQARKAKEAAAQAQAATPKAPAPAKKAAAKKAPAKAAKKAAAKPATVKGKKAPKAPTAAPANPDAMEVVAFRASAAQKAKFQALGGGEWARKRIDAAQVPA